MVYKHAYLNTLLLLHSAFMLSVVKMPQEGEVGGHVLNSHGNYIVDHGKLWNCVFDFCGNPVNHQVTNQTIGVFNCLTCTNINIHDN